MTRAEAATAVNNNAGATVLALRALAAGREVIVSRGELVEIGGSFRLPEIFEVSGARFREVGTTNKTRLSDYERAIGPQTAAILRVHRSNFRIVGFTEAPSSRTWCGWPTIGESWLSTTSARGRSGPTFFRRPATSRPPRRAIAAGADLVLLLRRQAARRTSVRHHGRYPTGDRAASSDPLMRALRLDKMTLAALEATLLAGARFRSRGRADSALVDDRHAGRRSLEACDGDRGILRDRARATMRRVVAADSFLGGGSAPIQPIPTAAVAISPPFPPPNQSEAGLAKALREGNPPVIVRIQKGIVLLDLRTIPATSRRGPSRRDSQSLS